MNWEEREEERERTRREKLGRRANSSQHDCFFLPRENTPILDKIRFTFDPNSSLRSGSLKKRRSIPSRSSLSGEREGDSGRREETRVPFTGSTETALYVANAARW